MKQAGKALAAFVTAAAVLWGTAVTAGSGSAAEALELGLANEICPAEMLEERAMTVAEEIAAKPAFALGLAKAQINRTQLDTLELRLRQELDMMAQASSHADAEEGIRAFAEKRTPSFNR